MRAREEVAYQRREESERLMDDYFATTTERRIWHLHHDGYSVPEIAEQLGVPVPKVRAVITFGWACQKAGK